MNALLNIRFALAWALPLAVGAAALQSPLAAWLMMLAWQVGIALAERVPALQHSPPATPQTGWHRWCIRLHVPLQAGLLALGLWLIVTQGLSGWAVLALGMGIGGVTGSQGITFAHELGHSRLRLDRVLAWGLMASVNYAHFMVEHYRGHHPRAATFDDPASARRGESLWRFLPRTLGGSSISAWRLEAQRLRAMKRSWLHSPLVWATLVQLAVMAAIGLLLGRWALLFWIVQSAYAIFLLEAINYIEHYGLRRAMQGTRPEPFGVMHAWNADHLLTNCTIANLQRHSDHHMHAWKPFAELEALPGPQLPTGYAGCIFLAAVPPLWFAAVHRRLDALPVAATAAASTAAA
ncbi:MAG: alkane 1-monooxygenase [Rubrivivax sp.]|nr:alkane 1-monooxygenase [Rubrivivax sp.]